MRAFGPASSLSGDSSPEDYDKDLPGGSIARCSGMTVLKQPSLPWEPPEAFIRKEALELDQNLLPAPSRQKLLKESLPYNHAHIVQAEGRIQILQGT